MNNICTYLLFTLHSVRWTFIVFQNELELSGLDELDVWLSLYCLCASDLLAWFPGKH